MATQIPWPADLEIHPFPDLYDKTTRTNFVLDVTSSRILALHDNVFLGMRLLTQMDEESASNELQKRGLSSEMAAESLRLVGELVKRGYLRPRTKETRATPPSNRYIGFMNLNLAHDCTLACTYCFAGAGTYRGVGGQGLMSWDVAKAAMDLLSSQNLRHYEVGLFGGEPLLNKSVIMRVVPYAKHVLRDVSFMLSTNGTPLDEELVDLFSSHGITVQISCDGAKRLQDTLRPGRPGVDSFERVTDAVALLKKKGVRAYHARATVTHLCPSPSEILLELMAIGFERAGYQPISGYPRLELTPEDEERYCQDIRNLIRSGLVSNSLYVSGILSKVQRASRISWFCSAGYNGVTVTPDGSLFTCHRMIEPEHRVGDVWHGVDQEKVERLYPMHSVDDHEPCCFCWARYFCGGGCYAENMVATGHNWKPWPTRCRILRATLEAVIEYCVIEPARTKIQHAMKGAANEAVVVET